MESELLRGNTPTLVLAALADGPQHGYAIAQEINKRTDNSLKFKQAHQLTDVRLALGYSAVVIAALTFAADFQFGWDATKAGTFWAVLAYFAFNGALNLWIWGVEKNVVYSGFHNGVAVREPRPLCRSVVG